jgi:hypothetical protein
MMNISIFARRQFLRVSFYQDPPLKKTILYYPASFTPLDEKNIQQIVADYGKKAEFWL